MKNAIVFCLALLSVSSLLAQSPKYRVVSIPVERNTILLRQPWVGGLNSPQFSPIDLNGDGYKDLFVFDRVGDKVLTYTNNGTGGAGTFDYAPHYEKQFPDFTAWALARDYNHDGIADVFTHVNAGIGVFKGRMDMGLLRFDTVSSLLLYTDSPYHVNIYSSVSDIPVITDVNFDGDEDILTYGVFGAGVEYYENQTVENPGNVHYAPDSLKFLNPTLCWGNFQQSSISNSIALNVSCKGGGSGIQFQDDASRHAGNAIFGFDDGNDHDIDLLNGNVGYDNLMFLENGGDSTYGNITAWDSAFPVCNTPVYMPTYPAAFGADITNDGLEDILVSPNVGTPSARDVKNVMWYKNVNNQLCNFEYQSDSMLVADMLDFGTDSKPVFFDFNNDGLLDIIVGNYSYFRPSETSKGTLACYENIGTATQPGFKMRSENYSNFNNYLLSGVFPAFGDLDGDGFKDMITGEQEGYLHFFKNTGGTVADFSAMTTPLFFGIDIGTFSAPFIYDVNGDTRLDLVVGRKDGKLSYFWNFGTTTSPQFSPDSVNTNFGNINVAIPGYDGYSQPFIRDDGTGILKLFVGSNRGRIFEYAISPANLRSGAFALIDSNFLQTDLGSKATISIADINNDGALEYLSGNSRGGLIMHSDNMWDPTLGLEPIQPQQNNLKIYPNPAHGYFVCTIEGAGMDKAKVQVFNILGELIPVECKNTSNQVTVATSELSTGFYIVRVTCAGKSYTGKILVDK